jgi:MraZ protein
MLIGSYSARFDSSGRLKIPEKFRSVIEEQYGKEVFITSLTDESVQIYPLQVWQKLTGITNQGLLHLKPDVRIFMLRVNRKGTRYELDSKGRILINQDLREKAQLEEEVEIIGLDSHIEIWNKKALDDTLRDNPLTNKDFEKLSELTQKD